MRMLHLLSVFLFCAVVSGVGLADDAVVLPSGYVRLDHITFDAPAYVRTGLTPENGWKIAVDFEPKEVTTGGNHCLWCARKSNTASDNWVFFLNVNGHPQIDFYDKRTDLTSVSISVARHLFVLDGQTLSIDGETIATAAMTEAFTAGGSLNLFGSSNGTTAPDNNWVAGKFYGAKIWNGAGELVMNIVPCLKTADGSLAFYDAVGAKDLTKSGTFYSNDYKTWKPGVTSGDFTAGSSWADGLAPQNYDTIEFSDVSTTVTFPAETGPTTFAGLLYLQSPSPASASPMREVVFDTRGTAFNYITDFTTHPFVRGWSWSNNKWNSGAENIFFYKGTLSDTFVMDDALVRVQLSTNGIKVVQEQGRLSAARSLHLIGRSNGSDVTNWTEWVVQSGDFLVPLKLRANTRFTFNSEGSFCNGKTLALLPNADNTGDYFGGGRAELLWTAGTNSNNYGDLQIGCYGGADALFTMTGTAYYYRSGTGNGTHPNLTIAGGTASNSSPTTPVRAEAIFAGSSRYRVLGRNDSGNQYGNISIACQGQANAINATGFMTIRDDASVQCDKGKIRMASSEGARAYLTVEGRGLLKALGTETAKLAAADVGIRMGGPLSVESVVTVRDEATLEVPRIAAIDASTHGDFVRNALVLEGGTLKTVQIEGNALDVEISGGVICASAASTVEKPLIGGLKSLTVADGARVVIDTQGFDVYVNQDFGEGVTVEKRGTGTLYVAGPSSHALTLVYDGALVKTDESFAFGQIITALDAATWNAAVPANWSDWTSWDPEGLVGGRTAVTVGNAAEMVIQDGDEAKSLTVTADGSLSLSGETTLTVNESVNVTGDGTAKVWNVAEGSSVEIVTPAFAAATTAFKKTGDGRLAFDFSTINADVAFVDGAASVVHPLEVSGGELCIKGKKPSQTNSKLGSGTGVSQTTFIGNGARLVYDSCAASGRSGPKGDFYVGYEGAGNGTFVLVNGAMMIGTTYVGYRPTVPCVATLAVTNASVIASAGKSVQFGSVASDAQAANLTAVARFGTGAKVTDCGGGTADGRVAFGVGMDVEFADGASIELGNLPMPNDLNHHRSWICANDRAFGSVRFVRGGTMTFRGGLMVNNFNTTVSAERNLVVGFDGGVLHPTITEFVTGREEVRELRYAIFRAPEYQGFEAQADGMTVDMSDCVRYTIAAPVRGEGALTKTGSGVLVLGKVRNFVSTWKSIYPCTDAWVTNDTTKVVESGVVTVQNAGGVHVAEGTVEVESGATDVNSMFTVDAGCTVDLAGNTVELGMLKGEGVVSGGTIAQICFKPLADGESAATLENVAVQKGFVDFAGVAPGETVRIAKVGRGVTGAMAGASFRLKAVNAARGEKGAECAVDGDGNVTATAVASGLLVIFK